MKHIVVIIACALLLACAHVNTSSGVEFRYDKLKELHKGMPISQVDALLGKPLSMEKTENEIIYDYDFKDASGFKVILFNSSNSYGGAKAHLVFRDNALHSFSYEVTEPKK